MMKSYCNNVNVYVNIIAKLTASILDFSNNSGFASVILISWSSITKFQINHLLNYAQKV